MKVGAGSFKALSFLISMIPHCNEKETERQFHPDDTPSPPHEGWVLFSVCFVRLIKERARSLSLPFIYVH